MARNKALKNVPRPDEEKLRALYQAPTQLSQRDPVHPGPGVQDYVSTSNEVYERTSPQAYLSTSPHVYKQTNPLVDKCTSQPPVAASYQSSYQAAPPGHLGPQGLVGPERGLEACGVARTRSTVDVYRRQTYHLRPDQIEKIRVEAFHSRRKISEVLRDIIDQYYRAKGEM